MVDPRAMAGVKLSLRCVHRRGAYYEALDTRAIPIARPSCGQIPAYTVLSRTQQLGEITSRQVRGGTSDVGGQGGE